MPKISEVSQSKFVARRKVCVKDMYYTVVYSTDIYPWGGLNLGGDNFLYRIILFSSLGSYYVIWLPLWENSGTSIMGELLTSWLPLT
jgi:hypothetical protein